jgi:AbrB family looped-hinge helix DNA binding protein
MNPPKGKHIFGNVKVGPKGQIVIPKEARDIFGIKAGDFLLLLGDEERGLAIITPELTRKLTEEVHKLTQGGGEK